MTTGSGIYVSASFKAWPFAGEVRLADNLLLRCGAHESGPGGPTGAIRLLALDEDMIAASFVLSGNRVVAPLESALSLQGPRAIGNLAVDGLVLEQAGGAALLDVRPNAMGEATLSDTRCPAEAAWSIAPESTFAVLRRDGAVATRLAAAPPRPDRSLPAGDHTTRPPDWILETARDVIDFEAPDAAGTAQHWGGPQDISARIWLWRDADALRVHAEVRDDRHHQDGDAAGAWRGDGVQLGLLVPGRQGQLEIGAALHNDGSVLRSLWSAPPGVTAESFTATVRRIEGATTYDLAILRAPLGLSDAVLDAGFRFNMIVNDNDGVLRKGFVRIAPGIGESKNSASFPVIRLE